MFGVTTRDGAENLYSVWYTDPVVKRKRKGTENASLAEGDDYAENDSRATHSMLFNVIQNGKRLITETINAHGWSIIQTNQRVTGGLHVQESLRVYEHASSFLPLAARSTNPATMVLATDIAYASVKSTYAKYCDVDHTTTDDDFEQQPQKFDLTHPISLLAIPPHTTSVTFAGLYVEANDNNSWAPKISIPEIELNHDFKTIKNGGGPFVDFVGQTGQMLTVLCISSEFILRCLHLGSNDVVPTFGEFPFEKMQQEEFDKIQYKPEKLILSKRRQLQFLLQEDDDLQPDAMNKLIFRYLHYLLHQSSVEEIHDEVRIDEETLKSTQFEEKSLGDVCSLAVDCLIYIFEDKVILKKTLECMADCTLTKPNLTLLTVPSYLASKEVQYHAKKNIYIKQSTLRTLTIIVT